MRKATKKTPPQTMSEALADKEFMGSILPLIRDLRKKRTRRKSSIKNRKSKMEK